LISYAIISVLLYYFAGIKFSLRITRQLSLFIIFFFVLILAAVVNAFYRHSQLHYLFSVLITLLVTFYSVMKLRRLVDFGSILSRIKGKSS